MTGKGKAGEYRYDGEWINLGVKIEKVFDGSAMNYEIVDQSSVELSEKFKNILRKDWDIDVDEYTAYAID